MKKKFIIIAAALLFLVPLSVLFQFMWNMSLSSKAKTAQGNTVSLDKSIAEILAQTDREMSKQGYIINPKRIDSYNSDGTTELLPVGGMDMRSIKVISTYTLPREIMSHEKSAYGSFLEKCQGLFGRLPEIFYSLDLTKYEGNTEYREVETKIEYMTYRIDDGEEVRIDKNDEDETKIEYAVTDIERGEHTIYVTAVDSNGNIAKDEAPILVSSDKPTIDKIDIDRENGKIIIVASDLDGIESIEVNLNGEEKKLNNINRTEATFSLNLKEGNNTLSIKLTNVNGLVAEGATEFTYAK